MYDAWNRLVVVKNSGGTTLATYRYDALGRRVRETRGSTTTDLYYSSAWQVVEERVGSAVQSSYVWSPVYVDALVARDRDADGNSANGLEERLYALQDANFNVVGLVNTSSTAVERYQYDSYGTFTVLDGSWGSRSGSSYTWNYLFQGGRWDPDGGVYSFRNRQLSPTLGRWLQNDPIGCAGGDHNLFRFINNQPANGSDPTGLLRIEPIITPAPPVRRENWPPASITDLATWDFTLNEAKKTPGYFVQHVVVYLERQECPCHAPPEGPSQKVAEFWEIAYVPANQTRSVGRNPGDDPKTKVGQTDSFLTVGAKPGTCGNMKMIGYVRYFPATAYFDPQNGIGFAWDPWSYLRGGWWPGGKFPKPRITYPFNDGTQDGISPGYGPSTGIKPTWWDTAYDKREGTGMHTFDYKWAWCAPKKDAEPILDLEGSTSESNGCDESRK